jgi:hypothetical protein
MGLDQYAYRVESNTQNTDFSFVTFDDEGEETYVEIARWRKHPNLQGFMEALYHRKRSEQRLEDVSGDWQEFNCQPVRLTLEDLAELEGAVKGGELPPTTGFFFGESQPEDKVDDLRFIKAAREAIKEGYEVYYDSWW